jgi:hypothetical protein
MERRQLVHLEGLDSGDRVVVDGGIRLTPAHR